MKTTLNNKLGRTSVFALVTGLASFAFAGPSPQFWLQQEKTREEIAARRGQVVAPAKVDLPTTAVAPTASPAPVAAATTSMACAACKTVTMEEFSATNVSGKIAPRFTPVGTKHECAACGGAIAKVRGYTTNDMKNTCPICAATKATNAGCCMAG